jgi:hypothetical protein
MAIKDWSATAASNTSINGINVAEGCAPSGINDAIRQLMADVKTADFGTTAPKTDAIAESTSGAGVTIDGLLIKDGAVSGMVVGPSSAVSGQLAAFDGTTGKLLKDAGDASTVRTLLGLVIGTNVPAYDSDICISDVVKSYTAQHYAAPVVLADLTAIDCDLHALATYTLAANGTLPAASNQAAGKIIEIIITGASTYTLSANANWKMADGTAVVFTPAAGKRTHIIAESDGTYMLIHRIVQEA